MPPRLRPRNIILDFDNTITTSDTISSLANFAIRHQVQQGKDFQPIWDDLVQKYTHDISLFLPSRSPPETRTTISQEIGYLRSLRTIENRSLGRTSYSGIFAGISDSQWKRAGEEMVTSGEVTVRKGFKTFMNEALDQNRWCGVVSVNWSSHFIQGVLSACLGPRASEIEVMANRIDEKGGIRSGGEDRARMMDSEQKLWATKWLVRAWDDGLQNFILQKAIYVGDSVTDLECLLAEEVVGIVMDEEGDGNLMKTLQRLTVDIDVCEEDTQVRDNVVYWAKDFDDIRTSGLLKKPQAGKT